MPARSNVIDPAEVPVPLHIGEPVSDAAPRVLPLSHGAVGRAAGQVGVVCASRHPVNWPYNHSKQRLVVKTPT